MMDFTRALPGGDPQPVPIHALTTRQRQIVEAIDGVEQATGEPCGGRFLARRFNLDPTTIREHLKALHRKGWLRTPNAPASLLRTPRD